MCLIAFAWQTHPRWPLLLIANRDEFHARPTEAAAFWPAAPRLAGGRDLECGGSWLLLSRNRRLAALTNIRVPGAAPAPRSRGWLVRDFAAGRDSAEAFVAHLAPSADQYGPFHLLLWDGEQLRLASNHPQFDSVALEAGVHALSNGPAGVEWSKMRRAREGLQAWLAEDAAAPEALFEVLGDRHPAADDELPDTGIGSERERLLSAIFVHDRRYGTRASSIVCAGRASLHLLERRFGPDGERLGESDLLL